MVDVDSDDELDQIFDRHLYLNRFERKGKIDLTKHGILKFFKDNRYPLETVAGWSNKIREPKFHVEIRPKGSIAGGKHYHKTDPVVWSKTLFETDCKTLEECENYLLRLTRGYWNIKTRPDWDKTMES